jgi:hypothetical protein
VADGGITVVTGQLTETSTLLRDDGASVERQRIVLGDGVLEYELAAVRDGRLLVDVGGAASTLLRMEQCLAEVLNELRRMR